MKIGIIGLGLIGGSYGLSLKKRFEEITIYGWDNNNEHLNKAKQLGIIDHAAASLDDLCTQVDWIILSIPVDAIENLLPVLLDEVRHDQVVIDFGSTKRQICEKVAHHKNRKQYLAAHPIAGTEYSGPEAAFAKLYDDKVMIVCESSRTDKAHVEAFRKQCKMLGMTTSYLEADEHDTHLAYVSHLSHIISFALSHTALKKEKDDQRLLDLAGSGFESTVRLAKSSPDMWTPIFMKNRKYVLESLDSYIEHLSSFRENLAKGDAEEIYSFLKKGREIRKILE